MSIPTPKIGARKIKAPQKKWPENWVPKTGPPPKNVDPKNVSPKKEWAQKVCEKIGTSKNVSISIPQHGLHNHCRQS